MKYIDLYRKLQHYHLFLFDLKDLGKFFPHNSSQTLKVQIHTWKKKGWIKTLKRGLYKVIYPEEKNIPDLYIANRLYSPSYVSLETALSLYSIIPQIAFKATSITTKPTRIFGQFIYRSISPKLFTGYRIIKDQGFEIKIAEPEKALLDYLYLKSKRKEDITDRFEKIILKQLNRNKIQRYLKMYPKNISAILNNIYA